MASILAKYELLKKNSSRIYNATNVKIYLDPIEIKGSVIYASMRLIFCAKKTRPNVPVDLL